VSFVSFTLTRASFGPFWGGLRTNYKDICTHARTHDKHEKQQVINAVFGKRLRVYCIIFYMDFRKDTSHMTHDTWHMTHGIENQKSTGRLGQNVLHGSDPTEADPRVCANLFLSFLFSIFFPFLGLLNQFHCTLL
jgi:hypothetical protein